MQRGREQDSGLKISCQYRVTGEGSDSFRLLFFVCAVVVCKL